MSQFGTLADLNSTHSLYITDQNKMGPGNMHRNYNTGLWALKIFIEPYCPFLKDIPYPVTVTLNSETFKNLDPATQANFSYVPGLAGIYLKEQYVYLNNYLVDKAQASASNTSNKSQVGSGGSVSDVYTTGWYSPSFTPDLSDPAGLCDSVNYQKAYFKDQCWVVGAHPMTQTTPYPNGGLKDANGKAIPTTGQALWQDGSYVSSNGIIQCPQQYNLSGTDGIGVHWRIEKLTPLFRGEDFFITFKKSALAPDFSKAIPIVTWAQTGWDFLNVYSGTLSPPSSQSVDSPPPPNNAIVSYEIVADAKDPKQVTYNISDKSQLKLYDFNIQPYYLIEIGSDSITGGALSTGGSLNTDGTVAGQASAPTQNSSNTGKIGNNQSANNNPGSTPYDDCRYFIIITANWYPTFIRVQNLQGQNNTSQNISFPVSVFKSVSGQELINKTEFTMTVRNHLGSLVVVFSGYESEPWIINNISLSANETEVLLIPPRKIAVMGGNISSSIIFSPLTYTSRNSLTLPPNYNMSGANNAQSDPNVDTRAGFNLQCSTAASPETAQENIQIELFQAQAISSDLNSAIKNCSDANVNVIMNATNIQLSQHSGPFFSCDTQILYCGGSTDITINPDQSFQVQSTVSPITQPVYLGFIPIADGLKYYEPQFPSMLAVQIGSISQATDPVTNNPVKSVNFSIVSTFVSGSQIFNNPVPGLATLPQTTNSASAVPLTSSDCTPPQNVKPEDLIPKTPWTLPNCKTPILPEIKFYYCGDETKLWNTSEQDSDGLINDIGPLCQGFSDTWSCSDNYNTIEHSGSMEILVNPSADPDTNDIINKILAIRSRAFYVTVDVFSVTCNYQQINVPPDPATPEIVQSVRLFTGLCKSATLEQESGKNILKCKLEDYSTILKDTFFLNSPIFDAMRDINAVYEIIRMAGFDEDTGTSKGNFPAPNYLMRTAAEWGNSEVFSSVGPDGRKVLMQSYTLPQALDQLKNAYFKFADKTTYHDAIQQLAVKASKAMFFDSFGVFHYENRKFDDQIFAQVPTECLPVYTTATFTADWYFTSSPFDLILANPNNTQLILNTISREYTVTDVYTSVNIVSATPFYEYIVGSRINEAGYFGANNTKPNGWLGYRRNMLQLDGVFGSVESVEATLNAYAKFFKPPKTVTIETVGQPIRALDVMQVKFTGPDPDDGSSKYVITNVSSTLAPNKPWMQTIQGEYFAAENNCP